MSGSRETGSDHTASDSVALHRSIPLLQNKSAGPALHTYQSYGHELQSSMPRGGSCITTSPPPLLTLSLWTSSKDEAILLRNSPARAGLYCLRNPHIPPHL